MFRRWHKPLRWLFHMYAHSDSTMEVQETSFEDQKESGVTLGPKEWQVLCELTVFSFLVLFSFLFFEKFSTK